MTKGSSFGRNVSFRFAMSASVGFEHEVVGDYHPHREARPDRQRRRDIELSPDDLLPDLAGAVRCTLLQRAGNVALVA
jgi:hypothetical protein